MSTWELVSTDLFARRYKDYVKKHPDELSAVLDNLDTYVLTLNRGVNPAQIKAGFIHSEPNGVIAIDQRGYRRKLRETRLYIYVRQVNQVLHLITIGDKNSQKSDLVDCRSFVDDLKKESTNG